jgi:hypothetical protein
LLLVVAAVLAHLFNPSDWPPLGIEILHSLHGPGFAAVALLLLWYLHAKGYSAINYVIAGIVAMLIGLLSEIAQIPGARDAQLMDLVVDGLGVTGALGIVAGFDRRVRRQLSKIQRLFLPVFAGIALAIVCVPTLWYSYALARQIDAFPMLLTFDNSWERMTISPVDGQRPTIVKSSQDWGTPGNIGHGIELGRWGIFLSLHPLPDWRDYSNLSFVVAAHEKEFPMEVCIRDERPKGDPNRNRYCKRIPVTATPARYTITFEEIQLSADKRPFDFSRVEAVVFSAAKPGNQNELLIDNIRLEK